MTTMTSKPLKSKGRVELHFHLDGAVRLATAWELSKDKGLSLPGDGSFQAFTDAVVATEPANLADFLLAFKYLIPPIKGDVIAIERIAYEACIDQARCGVLYFEARYSPHSLSTSDVSPEMVIEAVNEGFRRGAKELNIMARSILCCIIGQPNWCKEVVRLCDEYRNDGVVGIDIAGDEAAYGHGTDIKIPQPYIDAFIEAKNKGIHRTMHAGEVGSYAVVDKALHVLHAERIGHGYHVLENEQLYQEVLSKNIHFEMCPHSSILTGAVTETTLRHPIVRFAMDNANFSINTDDPTITDTWITDEIDLVDRWGLDEIYVVRSAFNAARSCFLPDNEKEDLINRLKVAYGVTLD